MKHLIIFLLIINSNQRINAQNLIPNGSFELINTCQKYHERCAPKAWRSSNLKNFYYPEYLPNTKMAIPPFKGSRSIALTFYYQGKAYERKFAQAALICPLIEGERYHFKIHYLLKKAAVENFGIYFADSLKVFTKNDFLKTAKPQIIVPVRQDLAANEWAVFETAFTATGNEKGIILGNFAVDSLTTIFAAKDIYKRNFEKEKKKRIYVRFDDLSLTPINETAHADCTFDENLAAIYNDSIRHILEHPRTIHPLELELNIPVAEQTFDYSPPIDTYIIREDTVQTNKIFSFKHINFETNSARLFRSSYFTLNQIVEALQKNPSLNLRIVGHTDDVGLGNFNRMLSEMRARSVADFLVSKGIKRRRLTTFGMGESTPISGNNSEGGRLKNRRVEFLLVK
jgi:outer membrane protein OmpA-like peptidoglycan-associated protein